MKEGKVKWFDPNKGYGFLTDGIKDYFVFYNSIDMAGYRKLQVGQDVKFEVKDCKPYDKQATKVKII